MIRHNLQYDNNNMTIKSAAKKINMVSVAIISQSYN